MKAAVVTGYGDPGVIRIADVPRAEPGDGEVLIEVRAAAVNPLDGMTAGKPYTVRLMTGLRRPRTTRIGVDVAGRVAALGPNATRFRLGDDVFGFCLADPHAAGVRAWMRSNGAFSEYACIPEDALAGKPAAITFAQAAATPVAAVTAWQGLHGKARIRPGQQVLVNGAAGGVGTFAVQIAKYLGAEVTAVCSTPNADLVRSIGADRVIDYTRENFTQGGRRWDVIFDCVGNYSLAACRRALTRHGVYIGAGSPPSRWMLATAGRVIAILALSRLVSQELAVYLAQPRQQDLLRIRDLIAAGKITPVIDRSYPLDDLAEAMRYQQARHAHGKVIIIPAAAGREA